MDNDTNIVKAYFVNKVENLIVCKQFRIWDLNIIERCLNLKLIYEELEQKVILVELDLNLNTAISVSTDRNSTISKTPLDLQTAIIYAQYFDIPLFTKTINLQKKGIKVTKKFIEDIG